MKDWFYRLAPVILSVTGFPIIICLFFIHDILYDRWQWMFWLILLLFNLCSDVLIGTLVKKLYHGVYSMYFGITGSYEPIAEASVPDVDSDKLPVSCKVVFKVFYGSFYFPLAFRVPPRHR